MVFQLGPDSFRHAHCDQVGIENTEKCLIFQVAPTVLRSAGRDKRTGTSLACFDVFDTVLTRYVGSPEAVFLLLGQRLDARRSGALHSAEAFAHARTQAEKVAFANKGHASTLEDIYRELTTATGWSAREEQEIMQAELDISEEVIRVSPLAHAAVEAAREAGDRVIFISDMYLPSEWLKHQLTRHGLFEPGDRCYVSCEYGRGKRDGLLFAEVARAEGVDPCCLGHLGNDIESDVGGGKGAGVVARHFPEGNLNRYEVALDQAKFSSEGLSSAFAGASRLARLSLPTTDLREVGIRDVAASVAAPVLAGFVVWVLRRSVQLGLKRLYFISRDGQVLLEIARRLSRWFPGAPELRYLYGSRQAWNLAAACEDSDAINSWIWDRSDGLSVRVLLARLGLTPQGLSAHLSAIGLNNWHQDRAMSDTELQKMRKLLSVPEVAATVTANSKIAKSTLVSYFAQEGLLSGADSGIVDLGWAGSMHEAIAGILSSVGASVPIGFFFGLTEKSGTARRESYAFNSGAGTGDARFRLFVPLLEAFCAADHGTVVRFESGSETNSVHPVLKTPSNDAVLEWGLPLYSATIESFAEHLELDPELVNPAGDLRPVSHDLLSTFWCSPSRIEAEAWGDFPWEDGLGVESRISPFATSYRWTNVFAALIAGRIRSPHRVQWPAGTIALEPFSPDNRIVRGKRSTPIGDSTPMAATSELPGTEMPG